MLRVFDPSLPTWIIFPPGSAISVPAEFTKKSATGLGATIETRGMFGMGKSGWEFVAVAVAVGGGVDVGKFCGGTCGSSVISAIPVSVSGSIGSSELRQERNMPTAVPKTIITSSIKIGVVRFICFERGFNMSAAAF